MFKRVGLMVPGLVCLGLLAAGLLPPAVAQEEKEQKGLAWTHGLKFQVRKAGEKEFTNARAFGAEVFHDRDINKLVYVCETGALGLGSPAKLPQGADVKDPRLFYALDVKARPVGEASFDKARQFNTEVFADVNTANLVYLSEAGSLVAVAAASASAPETPKDPVWFHGLELKVRKAGEEKFDDKTKKVSLEVYKDENTGNLFYITDAGTVAVAPAGDAAKPTEVKGPTWYHAFEAKVRKANEKEFGPDTKTYSVEVYKDENVNTLIYVCETGALAVVPAGGVAKPDGSKKPTWLHGRAFRVRKADEKDFNDQTQRFGAEVYRDENSGNLVYLSETGAIAVTGK